MRQLVEVLSLEGDSINTKVGSGSSYGKFLLCADLYKKMGH